MKHFISVVLLVLSVSISSEANRVLHYRPEVIQLGRLFLVLQIMKASKMGTKSRVCGFFEWMNLLIWSPHHKARTQRLLQKRKSNLFIQLFLMIQFGQNWLMVNTSASKGPFDYVKFWGTSEDHLNAFFKEQCNTSKKSGRSQMR